MTERVIDCNGLALTTLYAPNRRGLPTATTDARGNTVTRGYDHRDRLRWERSPLLASNRTTLVEFEYDGNNNLLKTSTANFDENGVNYDNEVLETHVEYNVLNSPIKTRAESDEGTFIETRALYDNDENVFEQWSAAASMEVGGQIAEPYNKTTYTYNTRHQVETEVHGDTGSSTYTTRTLEYGYDADGNVTRLTETPSGAEAARTTYNTYDGFNRLDYRTDAMGNVTDYTYDAIGNTL